MTHLDFERQMQPQFEEELSSLRASLAYVRHGYHVVPAAPGKKVPILQAWQTNALSDERAIERTWKSRGNQELNVGFSCGPSGLVVIDLDPKNNSDVVALWEQVATELGIQAWPKTPTVSTPSGGVHIYFSAPEGLIRNSAGDLGSGIDVRGTGGYVLAPPSWQTGIGEYQWRSELSILEVDPVPLPDALALRLAGDEAAQRKVAPDKKQISEGQRHDALSSAAARMRNAGINNPDELYEGLREFKEEHFDEGTHPVSDNEVRAVAEYFANQADSYMDMLKRTDLGAAEWFTHLYEGNVLFIQGIDKWVMWNGNRWQRLWPDQEYILAEVAVREFYKYVAKVPGEAERKLYGSWVNQLEARSRRETMLKDGAYMLAARPSAFDQDEWLLSVGNGTLDLRTGELREPNPSDKISVGLGIDYVPDKRCPNWQRALENWFPADEGMQAFVQQLAGMALTGSTAAQEIYIFYGLGANGKSTFVQTIMGVLGPELAAPVTVESLLLSARSSASSTSPELAKLKGRRLAVADEVPEGRKLDISMIKRMTGGKVISARSLYKDPIEFKPTHKLWIEGNYLPKVSGSDEGTWRRLKVVPFHVTIPPQERMEMDDLLNSFDKEAVLAWMVEGCLAWVGNGMKLIDPKEVTRATSEYRTEEDMVRTFLEDKCRMHPDYSIAKKTLWTLYNEWLRKQGETAGAKSQNWFTRRVKALGIEDGGDGNRYFLGIEDIPQFELIHNSGQAS